MSNGQRFEFPNIESRDLFQTILLLRTVEELENFFRDLCTIRELKELTERWSIAKLASKNYPYRAITRITGASSTTIARVAHWLVYGTGGYNNALQRRMQLIPSDPVEPNNNTMLYRATELPLAV